ncbi:hypothetical protein EYE42_12185 [Paracoccus subflavus]|uniref:Uncharacterized protein n=1 Tax=Paracoccus subflavus TaxID=2528244 RepID=A0A4Q9G338_9RHOB|nr:hypothetical protein [Paracoccus subflavus]TBN38645.1 hypothetical protein EYE42_12185 [Paracoccus subflavus]
MLLRDLLVALPGIIAPTAPSSRAEEVEVQSSSSIVSPAATAAMPGTILPDTGASSGFLGDAFKDFYGQTGFQVAEQVEPGPAAPAPTEPDPAPPAAPDPVAPANPDPVPPVKDIPQEEVIRDEPEAGTGGNTGGGVPLPSTVDAMTAEAGRVTTIDISGAGDIADIRILSQTSHGHVSVNPDNTLSLVLSEAPTEKSDTSFRYEITYADGKTQEVDARVDVTPGAEPKGWGQGDFYMLETGADGRAVVEHGENHRKIYVTEGAHGLTRAEIAQAEGISASKVTAGWLMQNPEYGATPDKALATDLGMQLWYASTDRSQAATSNWLLFERGYSYENTGRLIGRGASGESALNPVYVGAYGEGTDPIIEKGAQIFQNQSKHVVIQDLDLNGFKALLGENVLLDNLSFTAKEVVAQGLTRFTLRESDIVDVAHLKPVNSGAIWDAGANKISGTYISGVDGALFDGNLFDRNGWAEGYDKAMSTSKAMPPSKFNHNLYVQSNNTDVTLRDNIFMRASSFGTQLRPGGVAEDNLFLDNNAALNFFKGGNYTLLLGNVVTSAGYKDLALENGVVSMGIGNYTKQSSLIDNIIAHLADPNNSAEEARKKIVHEPLSDLGGYVNDTIIYNWAKPLPKTGARGPDTNIDGLNTAVLDQTTIQNFTAQLLGRKTATISDLANHLRAQADGKLDKTVDADLINAFFREGFGLDTSLRAKAEVVRFVPDDRAEGMRWDNRLNWSTEDLPGTQDGDSVDLGGNRVLFATETVTVDDFVFGDFGQLKATAGKLTIAGEVSAADTGGRLQIDNAGQVWIDGYRDSDTLTVEMAGGRLANTGAFAGSADIDMAEDAQLLLATAGARFDLAGGSSLTVAGTRAKVGFDGGDGKAATMQFHDNATLTFAADKSGLGRISEFHSGAFDTSDVLSGVRLDGDLVVDLSALGAKSGGTWTLIDADQMTGAFDDIAITGLGTKRDALVRYDYTSDEVILLVSDAGKGTGQIRTATSGDERFVDYSQDAALKALWTTLQASMPAVTDDPI